MSERQVKERGRAYDQRQALLETKVRNLGLRAYRGAVRTSKADLVTPGIFSEPVGVLEVIIPSGRWLAKGVATFIVPAPVATVDLSLQIVVSDPLTDAEFTGENFDLPAGRYSASHTAEVVITVPCVGDLKADDNVKITLRTMNAAGDAYQLADVRLSLDPV